MWTPIVFPVPKILVIDVTVVSDVVPDVALLDILSAHHPQQSLLSLWKLIVFPVPKIPVIDVIVVLDVVLDVALLKIYCLQIVCTSSACHLHIVCMSSAHHL